MQPRVGQWKVLPGQRNSERDSAPAQLGTAPLLGPQHLPLPSPGAPPRALPQLRALLCSRPPKKRARAVSRPYPRGTAWVCSGPSGGPSAPACWGRPVCSRSSSTGSVSLQGHRSVGLVPAPAVAVPSPGRGWAHLGQVCASAAAAPGPGSLRSPASGHWAGLGHCSLRGEGVRLSPAKPPLCPPHPLKTGERGLGGLAGEAGALQSVRAGRGFAPGKAEV